MEVMFARVALPVWGAEAGGILATILATAWKQGQDAFAALLELAGPSPLPSAIMDS
jgi:hypothetical protein